MRKILYISVLLTALGCSNSGTTNEDVEDFVSEFDDKSIEEIKEEVNQNIKQFEAFADFFGNSFSNEIEHIKKEDERYEEAFKVDTTGLSKALQQFNGIIFGQYFEDYRSELEFAFGNSMQRDPLGLGQGMEQEFEPRKIYYHNAPPRVDSISNYNVSFHFEYDWGVAKRIDSIDIAYKVEYLKDYDVVEISKNTPTVRYKGGEINLEKVKDNYVYLTLSDTIVTPTKIQAINEDGKVLDRTGYSNQQVSPSDSKAVFTEMLSYLQKIQEKLNDDDFKDTQAFQDYLRANLSSLDYFSDEDGFFHRESYYKGSVDSMKLYFAKETDSAEVVFRARNVESYTNDDELFQMESENGLVFLNSNGEKVFAIEGMDFDIAKVGGNFYESTEYYYYLNLAEKRLDTLFVYSIEAFDNGLIGILPEQNYDDTSVYSGDNKLLTDKKYWNLRETGSMVIGQRDGRFYVLNEKGEETLISGVDEVYDQLENDRLLVSLKGKIGFINSKGKIVLPCIYDDAKPFEEGLTAVQFGGTYKLIDTQGKVIVDTGEEYLNFFGEDDTGKRIYKFSYGAKSYNYKGELL